MIRCYCKLKNKLLSKVCYWPGRSMLLSFSCDAPLYFTAMRNNDKAPQPLRLPGCSTLALTAVLVRQVVCGGMQGLKKFFRSTRVWEAGTQQKFCTI